MFAIAPHSLNSIEFTVEVWKEHCRVSFTRKPAYSYRVWSHHAGLRSQSAVSNFSECPLLPKSWLLLWCAVIQYQLMWFASPHCVTHGRLFASRSMVKTWCYECIWCKCSISTGVIKIETWLNTQGGYLASATLSATGICSTNSWLLQFSLRVFPYSKITLATEESIRHVVSLFCCNYCYPMMVSFSSGETMTFGR